MTGRANQGRIAATVAQNAVRTMELGAAASSVIAARMALGVQAVSDPRLSHLEEAARMTGEKFTAFGEAMAATAPSATHMGQKVASAGLAEASAAMVAGAAFARAGDPVTAVGVGARYASEAMMRTMGMWASLAGAAVGAQSAALAPIHRAATRNARRLKR